MHGSMFGDLSALALDDSGEINSFANEVINREVVAGNWRENLVELGGDAFRWMKNLGDRDKIKAEQLFRKEQATDKILDAVEKGQYARVLKNPRIYHIFEAEIDKQARSIVDKTISVVKKSDPNLGAVMTEQKEDFVARVKNLVVPAINKNQISANNNDLIININTPLKTKGLPDINVRQIKLNRADFEHRIDELKIQHTDTSKEYTEIQNRIDSRPKPVKGQMRQDKQGRKYVYNGVKWLLIGGAALSAWQNKDKLPGVIDSLKNDNSSADIGQSSTVPSSSPADAYNLNDSHDSSPGVIKNVNPGGSNPVQSPKAYGQDAWDKLKSNPTYRKKLDSKDNDDWWGAPSGSSTNYDDMGYVGGADTSWSRTAQKNSLDELSDSDLNNYGAGQIVAAQNFLAYYGLGSGKQLSEQIIPSLLMGNFDGMTFDEYKNTHSEEETRLAMQRFEQGLSMFSTEMTKLANNLESFYTERQRRFEAKSPSQPNQPVQQVQKPNEEPQRTE